MRSAFQDPFHQTLIQDAFGKILIFAKYRLFTMQLGFCMPIIFFFLSVIESCFTFFCDLGSRDVAASGARSGPENCRVS